MLVDCRHILFILDNISRTYIEVAFAILLYYVEHNKMVNTCVRSFVEDTKTCNRLTYLASFGEA